MEVAQEDGSSEKTETWREVYERLEQATPAERAEIVLELIEMN